MSNSYYININSVGCSEADLLVEDIDIVDAVAIARLLAESKLGITIPTNGFHPHCGTFIYQTEECLVTITDMSSTALSKDGEYDFTIRGLLNKRSLYEYRNGKLPRV